MEKDSSLKKEKINFFIFLLVIKALYVTVNIFYLPEEWALLDYDKDIHIVNLVFEIPIFLVFIGCFLKYYRPGNPLSFVSTLLLCIYVIPINSTLSLCDYNRLYYLSSNLYCFFLILALGFASQKLKDKMNSNATEELWNNMVFSGAMRVMTFLVAVGSLIYVYLIQGSLDFSMMMENEMYEKRADFAEFYMTHTNGIVAYIIIIWRGIVSTLLPIGFYAALRKKSIVNVILVVVAYLALFTLSMEKSTFLQPIIVLFIFILEKKKYLYGVCDIFVKGFAALLVLTWIGESMSDENSFLFKLVVSRMSYMPSYLNHVYFDFFDVHSKIWFTSDFFPLDKFVSMVLPAPYPQGMVNTISVQVFNETIPSPNTGLFAEAFAQMGYLGIFVFPFIVSFVAIFYTNYSSYYGYAGALILLSSFGMGLTNTALFSTMGMVRILIFVLITWLLVKPIAIKAHRIKRKRNIRYLSI